MGFEVEQKFRVVDHAGVRERLQALGARAEPVVEHLDTYLRHPARDFAATHEAFRLRRVGDHNALTYKGPRRPGPAKTREEIEIPFAAGPTPHDQMAALLDRLGFEPVAVVRKTREPFRLDHEGRPVEVVLDDAGVLGCFVEVETLAADEADLPAAQEVVLQLARRLELVDVEARSYLRMTLEQAKGT